MRILSKNIYLILIVLTLMLGVFLRFYKLDKIPSGFYVDEAAIGYNAYSILETGADEYGKPFPVFLRSYSAFSSPLYMYLTSIPISVRGLSVEAVRSLSAFSGSISILFIYLILKKLDFIKSRSSLIFGVFIFAISPWAIFYSRGSFEANLTFLLFCISVWSILNTEKQKKYYILSIVILAISTYAYQAYRLTAILLAVYFTYYVFRPKKIKQWLNKHTIIGCLLFIIIQLPQLMTLTSPAFSRRAGGLFYGTEIASQANKIPLPDFISYPLAFLREFGAKSTAYFSPRNLFHLPDPDPQRSIPELSVFYSWLVVPFFIGVYKLFDRIKDKQVQLIVVLAVTTVLPASLTLDPFSSLRSLGLLLPLTVILTAGFERLITIKPKLIIPTLALLFLISLIQLWRSYFVLLPTLRAQAWDYGYQELATQIMEKPDTKFLIEETRNNPSYILLAFFSKTDPKVLQESVDLSIKDNYYSSVDFDNNYKFKNIETGNLKWEEDIYEEQIIVGDPLTISEGQAKEHFLKKEFEILNPLGEVIFVGYRTDPKEKCRAVNYQNPLCKEL